MQPNTSRLSRNTFGRARWDDTQVTYWTRGDGRALSFSNNIIWYKFKLPFGSYVETCTSFYQFHTVDFSLKEVCKQISIPTYSIPNVNPKLLNWVSLGTFLHHAVITSFSFVKWEWQWPPLHMSLWVHYLETRAHKTPNWPFYQLSWVGARVSIIRCNRQQTQARRPC